MTPTLMGIIGLIGLLFIILVFRMPIAYAMAVVGFAGYAFLVSPAAAFSLVGIETFATFASYNLTVLPMFVLMGYIAFYSGIGGNLFSLTSRYLGHLRGGLVLAAQAASALFGAICGSMIACVATVGSIALPEMKKRNYNMHYAAAAISAGGSLATLIPPSSTLIAYGIMTEQPIAKLFAAGITAGIVHMLCYMGAVIILTRINPSIFPPTPKAISIQKEKAASSEYFGGGIIEVFLVFAITLGGLFLGWFTPTEAGAIGSFSILLITVIEKRIDWPKIRQALADTTKLTAMIFLLIFGATVLGRFIAVTRIPFDFASFALESGVHPYLIMVGIIGITMVLGCFIDAFALILLTIPVFFPVIVALGFDPIWFGIVAVVIESMGAETPPVGMGIFVIKGVMPELPFEKIVIGMIPFILADWAFFFLLMFIPSIATFLPSLLF